MKRKATLIAALLVCLTATTRSQQQTGEIFGESRTSPERCCPA